MSGAYRLLLRLVIVFQTQTLSESWWRIYTYAHKTFIHV